METIGYSRGSIGIIGKIGVYGVTGKENGND